MSSSRRSLRATGVAAVAGIATLAACASNSAGTGHALILSPLPSPTTAQSGPTRPAGTPTAHTTAPVSPSSSSPSVVIKPAPSTPIREKTVTSPDGKRSYDVKVWVEVQSSTCADHAYGMPIIQYLTAHPCQGLDRILATTVVNGKDVGFAQSSVGFVGNAPDVYQVAGKFASLERANGTGSVNDLFRDGYRLPNGPASLPSPDAFNVQSQDSAVTIVDAFYLGTSTPNNDPALIQMAQDIYLQF